MACLAMAPGFASAKDLDRPAGVAKDDIRLLGRLNVNQATREELLLIPALDPLKADELLAARDRGPLTSLSAFGLSEESLTRLSVAGPSTLRRIRPLPLESFVSVPATARR